MYDVGLRNPQIESLGVQLSLFVDVRGYKEVAVTALTVAASCLQFRECVIFITQY